MDKIDKMMVCPLCTMPTEASCPFCKSNPCLAIQYASATSAARKYLLPNALFPLPTPNQKQIHLPECGGEAAPASETECQCSQCSKSSILPLPARLRNLQRMRRRNEGKNRPDEAQMRMRFYEHHGRRMSNMQKMTQEIPMKKLEEPSRRNPPGAAERDGTR